MAIIALCFALVEFFELQFFESPNAEWFDYLLRDPNNNWVGLLFAGLGGGWLLARRIY